MKPTKVLIVEDEMIFALDVKQTLTAEGYETCELAADGQKALENLEKQKPDVVLIDINLKGGLSGIETAKEIRARSPIPVIFMTGYADARTREDADIVEPAGYLIKPFDIGKLIWTIKSSVGKNGL